MISESKESLRPEVCKETAKCEISRLIPTKLAIANYGLLFTKKNARSKTFTFCTQKIHSFCLLSATIFL